MYNICIKKLAVRRRGDNRTATRSSQLLDTQVRRFDEIPFYRCHSWSVFLNFLIYIRRYNDWSFLWSICMGLKSANPASSGSLSYIYDALLYTPGILHVMSMRYYYYYTRYLVVFSFLLCHSPEAPRHYFVWTRGPCIATEKQRVRNDRTSRKSLQQVRVLPCFFAQSE